MKLRSQTIRLGIFISTLIIAAIVVIQLIWLKKVYYLEQKEFDHAIARTVRDFYGDIKLEVAPNVHLTDLISSPNELTYFIKINKPQHYDSLVMYMHNELEDEDIFTDCYMGIYDADQERYVHTYYMPSISSAKKRVEPLPFGGHPYHHVALYFPHRRNYILSLMNLWLISSAILLIVLISAGASLYYFYRQTFLAELQRDFVNNFTHEFKTPVAVINLAAEVLDQPDIVSKPERFTKYAAIVRYQGRYLQQQIEQLLHYAFAEHQTLHLHKEPVHLQQVTKEAIGNLQPLIDEKKATLHYQFDVANDVVSGDRNYLLIVITNLVENALKYAKQAVITIRIYDDSPYKIISVKDNGKGIAPKYQHAIFKKFYRVPDGEVASARGFGLGLSFVKLIIDAQHGKIVVESEPGAGSTFSIKLPAI